MRLAIFDFCDTLVNVQSADEFCKYVLKKESRTLRLQISKILSKFYIYRIFHKINFHFLSEKKILLRGLKGITESKLNDYGSAFVDDYLQFNLNQKVFSRFKQHVLINDIVIINSGGYEIYLKYFAMKFVDVHLFSTELEFRDGFCTGRIKGNECLGTEKVVKMLTSEFLRYEYEDIFTYSDSITDLPIFNLATKKVVVLKDNKIPTWCQSNFEIITVC